MLMFCNITNVFAVTFDKFSASLLNTNINIFKKNTAVKLLKDRVLSDLFGNQTTLVTLYMFYSLKSKRKHVQELLTESNVI